MSIVTRPGSKAYPTYCSYGRLVNDQLEQLGGRRLIKVGEGNELGKQMLAFEKWTHKFLQAKDDLPDGVRIQLEKKVEIAEANSVIWWQPKANAVDDKNSKRQKYQ